MERWSKFLEILRQWIDRFLEGRYDYFACFLPKKTDFLSSLALRLVFSGMPEDQDGTAACRSMAQKGVVVYATKYPSLLEYHFFRTLFARHEAPCPEISFDLRSFAWQPVTRVLKIMLAALVYRKRFGKSRPGPYASDYFKKHLLSGRAGFLSMVDKRGFYRRYVQGQPDPVAYLLELQKQTDTPVFIVPQLLLYGRDPETTQPSVTRTVFGSEEKPGFFRRAAGLFRFPGKAVLEMSDPINLQEFLALPANKTRGTDVLAYSLRREIVDRLNRHRQSIIGPVLKTQQELKEMVLNNSRFQDFLQEYAQGRGKMVREFHKEADGYVDEIAARYDTAVISFLARVVRWLTGTMFNGVDVDMEGLKKLKSASRKGPLVLVPCHKSHIDYLILSYILYKNNFPCPFIAAGKNLSFFPIGFIFRHCGAFFIRRTFKGAVLYSKVFAEYIRVILSEKFNIEFFIEGGRSRTGKLVLPKFGLLSIILDAYKVTPLREMFFVPIFIGYDRVLEEGSYLYEAEGGEKKPEDIGGVVKARRFLKNRFGRIYVRFHDPIRIADVLNRFAVPMDKMDPEEYHVLIRNLGHRIIKSIDDVTVVTPHALAAASILTAMPKTFTEAELFASVRFYLSHLSRMGAQLSDTLAEPEKAVANSLDSFVKDRFIHRHGEGYLQVEGGEKARYTIIDIKRPNLEYYKNNCIAFFVPHAFTAMAVLAQEAPYFCAADLNKHYVLLQDLFKNEFHYDNDLPAEHYLRRSIKTFIDDNMLLPHPTLPDTYGVTEKGRVKMALFANFLKSYFESYRVVLRVLASMEQKSAQKKEMAKKIRAMAGRMLKDGKVTCREALSKITFDNAAEYFQSREMRGKEDETKIQEFSDRLDAYLFLLTSSQDQDGPKNARENSAA